MGAIKTHKTAVDEDSSWDGPAEVAQADNDATELRYMHAWVDDEGDAEAKSSYKFPHHAAGTDTPANIAGVNNALARLPQADIPEGDRAGVENHLRGHRRDVGLEDAVRGGHGDAVTRREPIRCFEGKTKPHEPFWKWRNAAEAGGEAELELYGYISEYSWFEDEVTPKMFKEDLYKYGQGGPITIRMNSYGGDVIAASMMSSIIKDYPGEVTVQVDGVAASAATVVAVAGDRIRMQETAYFMIHDPSAVFFLAELNIEELTRMASSLQAIKEGIINAYESKTGLSRPRLSKMMTDQTWMDAQRAVDLGFVDEVMRGTPAFVEPMENAAIVNALRSFRNVPEALLAQGRRQSEPVKMAESPEAAKLRAKVKILKRR